MSQLEYTINTTWESTDIATLRNRPYATDALTAHTREKHPSKLKKWLVYTSCSVGFFGAIATGIEVSAGMEASEIAVTRSLGALMNITLMPVYMKIREALAKKLNVTEKDAQKKRIVDIGTLLALQIPLSAGSYVLSGADFAEGATALSANTAVGLAIGRPFGWVLDKWSKLWGIQGTYQKQLSTHTAPSYSSEWTHTYTPTQLKQSNPSIDTATF